MNYILYFFLHITLHCNFPFSGKTKHYPTLYSMHTEELQHNENHFQDVEANKSSTAATETTEMLSTVQEKSKKIIDLRKFKRDQIRLMKPSSCLKNPFAKMKITDASFLNDLDGRTSCPQCEKSRKYFCYTCYIPMPNIANKIPQINVWKLYNFCF